MENSAAQQTGHTHFISLSIICPPDQHFEELLHLQRRAIFFNRMHLVTRIISLKMQYAGRYCHRLSNPDLIVNAIKRTRESPRYDLDGHLLVRMGMYICNGSMRRHLIAHLENFALRIARSFSEGNRLTGLRILKRSCGHDILRVAFGGCWLDINKCYWKALFMAMSEFDQVLRDALMAALGHTRTSEMLRPVSALASKNRHLTASARASSPI